MRFGIGVVTPREIAVSKSRHDHSETRQVEPRSGAVGGVAARLLAHRCLTPCVRPPPADEARV